MKKRPISRFLAFLLCICTVVSGYPGMPETLSVYAAEPQTEDGERPQSEVDETIGGGYQAQTESGGGSNGAGGNAGEAAGADGAGGSAGEAAGADGAGGSAGEAAGADGAGGSAGEAAGADGAGGSAGEAAGADGAGGSTGEAVGADGINGSSGAREEEYENDEQAAPSVGQTAEPVISGWYFGDNGTGDLLFDAGTYTLILAGGGPEAQISYEEITGRLPSRVTVTWTDPVSDRTDNRGGSASGEVGASEQSAAQEQSEAQRQFEEVLSVVAWNCPEYVRDGDGNLPYRGTFFFRAVFDGAEKEYALGDGVQQIGVRVVFDEPLMLAAVTAAPGTITSDQEWGGQTLQAGTYTIAPGVTVTVTGRLTVNGTVTINGGGTIARDTGYAGTSDNTGAYSCMLYVTSGGTLNLEDVTVDGKEVDACGPAVYQTSGSVMNLRGGAVIQNNRNLNTGTSGVRAGGGIYCEGTLNINGGVIRNCRASGAVVDVYSHAGGAIYLKGICNMTAGSITGNSALNGGGIYLASTGATLKLSGGTISGNSASGNGNGIYYSTLNAASSILSIGGNANVADVIYLDNSTGSLCPSITSELSYPITLACSSKEEGKVLARGSGYTLTGVDASKVSMAGTGLYSRLDKVNNCIYLSAVVEAEAAWQETSGGAWKTGSFMAALENVYDGGTVKLLKDILITGQVKITKQITITSDDPAAPRTMTRMPEGNWGNITLSGSSAKLLLTNIIYDGNRDYLSGTSDAVKQSLIKVGANGDTGASLILGNGCIIRNGYKTGGSGVIAVYGSMEMSSGAVIENCEVSGTGGALWVSSSGTFTMNGGTIRGCKANDGGAAISVDGTCILNGGSITDNTDASNKNCALYLRSSGSGVLTVNGVGISGNTHSIYNDGKRVVIAGNSPITGTIYTTNGVFAERSGVSGLSGNYTIQMPVSLESGDVVVTGSTDNVHYQLANEGFMLSVSGGNLIAAVPAYTVTYYKNGGTISNETRYTSYLYGTGLTLPVPVRVGYTFDGWYESNDFKGEKITAILTTDNEDKVYYAKWTDQTAPTAPRLPDGVMLPAGWTNTQTIIPLTFSDEAGVTKLWVKVDDGEYTEVEGISEGTTVRYDFAAAEGDHTYTFRAEDAEGNTSPESEPFRLKVDTVKPEIRFFVDGGAVSGNSYETAPDMTVTVTDGKDAASSGGIASVTYQIGSGSVQAVDHGYAGSTVCSDTFIIPASEIPAGEETIITVQVTDRAGNTSSFTQKIRVKAEHVHSLKKQGAVQPTCTAEGTDVYWICEGSGACGKMFLDAGAQDEITEIPVIDAAGHSYGGWMISAEPTVDAEGMAERVCARDGAHKEAVTLPALNDTSIWEESKRVEPTETTPGSQTYVSEYGTVTIPIPALGHTHRYGADWKSDSANHWHACECGDRTEITAHSYGDWIVDQAATESEAGAKHRICTVCGYNESDTIPATGGGNTGGGNTDGGNTGGGNTDGGNTDGSNTGGDGNGGTDSGSSNSGNNENDGTAGGEDTDEDNASGNIDLDNEGAGGSRFGNITAEVAAQQNAPATSLITSAEVLTGMLLTEEEKQLAEGGTDVRIILNVKDASDLVTEEEKAFIESILQGYVLSGYAAQNYVVGQYLDISLYKLIGQDRTQITETAGKIRITIAIPERLKTAGGGAILRIHGSQAELLPDLDDDADTITIETNQFSTYVLVLSDQAADDGNNGADLQSGSGTDMGSGTEAGGHNGQSGPTRDDEPKTGDAAPIELYATLTMIAGFTYLLLYFADGKHGMTEETKKELVSRIIRWARRGRSMRRLFALVVIFLVLVYYHSIGKKSAVAWAEIYEK